MDKQQECGGQYCTLEATHVVIQGSPDAKLFPMGAALLCDTHTESASRKGGVPMGITEFYEAASDRA